MNPLKAFTTLADARSYLRNSALQVVRLPALVPYLAAQLDAIHLLEDIDSGTSSSRNTPALYQFVGDLVIIVGWLRRLYMTQTVDLGIHPKV